MLSQQEVSNRLQTFIDAAQPLKTLDYNGIEWALWKDEVNGFLQENLGPNEGTQFGYKLSSTINLLHPQASSVRGLEQAVVYLHVLKGRVGRGEYAHVSPNNESEFKSPPSVFIAHSGEPPALFRLTRFLEALGVKPVVAEWLPFQGRQVPDQARSAMDGCEAAIVFATGADAVGERKQPGRGALTETGILQERFGNKVIYLVEEGAELGPMVEGFAHESFTQDCLEKAFYRIVVELKAHKII